MTAYRDERERCPRCKTELIDAAVARACTQCGGLWIGAGGVQEMVAAMRTPPEPVRLMLEPHARETIGCPACGDPMDTRLLYGVEIERLVRAEIGSGYGRWASQM